jgi:lipopolysaccharide exporter
MIAMRWATRALGLVSTIILARLLAPEDFGLIATAMVVVGFLEVLTHTGVDLALIRDRQATREHYDTAWTFEILQGAVLAIVLAAIAPYAARHFGDPRVADVVYMTAVRALIGGFENIGVVAFRRDLTFDREFWFGVAKKVSSAALTVGAAVWLRSYWALVIGLVGGRLLDVVISYVVHPYRPRLTLARFTDIWNFSQWLLLSRIANMLNRKFDEFTVASQAGTVAMGHYYVASDIAAAPTEEVVLPMSRGIFPVYSRQLDDRTLLAQSFRTVLASTAYLCIALGFGLSSVAPQLVPVFLGQQWLFTIPIMEWLGVCAVLIGLAATLDTLLLACGHASLSARFKWLQLAALAPAVWWAGGAYGAPGIAIAKTLVMAALLPLMVAWSLRRMQLPLALFGGAVWRPLAGGVAMYLAVRAVVGAIVAPQWVELAAGVATGGLVFVGVTALLWILRGRPPGPESALLGRAKGLMRRPS